MALPFRRVWQAARGRLWAGAWPSASARAREPAAEEPLPRRGRPAGWERGQGLAGVNAGPAGLGVPRGHGALLHPRRLRGSHRPRPILGPLLPSPDAAHLAGDPSAAPAQGLKPKSLSSALPPRLTAPALAFCKVVFGISPFSPPGRSLTEAVPSVWNALPTVWETSFTLCWVQTPGHLEVLPTPAPQAC